VEEESQKERRFFHLTFSIRLSRTVRIRLTDTVHIGAGAPQQSAENGRGTVRAPQNFAYFSLSHFSFLSRHLSFAAQLLTVP